MFSDSKADGLLKCFQLVLFAVSVCVRFQIWLVIFSTFTLNVKLFLSFNLSVKF